MKNTIIIVLLILVCLGGIFYLYNKTLAPAGPVSCTTEAMICPDGSAVGRVGPNCEFAPCPNVPAKDGTTASLNQRILSNGVYITPLKVESDSRCPIDVKCFWAGEVILKVRLEKGGVSKEVTLKQDTPFVFQGSEISLVGVSPENEAGKPFTQEAYVFTFKVK